MTADSNTQSGQEPERQYQNPSQVLTSNQATAADPGRGRFSAAAITGMVLVTIIWVFAIGPLINALGWGVSGVPVLDLIVFSGVIVLFGGLAGFFFALIDGNKKRAARRYIIPSLIWQGIVLTGVILLLVALAGYDPY